MTDERETPGGDTQAFTKTDDEQTSIFSHSADSDKSSIPLMVTAVLACLKRGWFVVPLCWPEHGQCGCPKHHTAEKEIGKAPLQGNGYQHSRLTREEITNFLTRHPRANYGILLEP